MNFRIKEINDYNKPVTYDFPVKIGHFSTDSENRFCDDDHQLKILSMPESLIDLHIDLSANFSEFIRVYKDEEPPFNKLLRWIVSHKDVINMITQEDLSKGKIHFVCQRSVLNAINSTIYEKYNEWLIYATKFRSIIYLCKIDTETRKEEEKSWKEDVWRTIHWGYKFEEFLSTESNNSNDDTSRPLNVNEKYFAVMKAKLGKHRLQFSGEMDAVDPQAQCGTDSTTMKHFVEIKTREIQAQKNKNTQISDNMTNSFRWKLLNWYMQCFIAGIPRVVCGYRNKTGIVKEIKVYDVSDLPRMAEDLWSKDACLNFGSCFLNFVKKSVVKDDPKVVYEFYWKPGASVITCEKHTPQFLPEWYISKISEAYLSK